MTGLAVGGAIRIEGSREEDCRAIAKGWRETARGEASARGGVSEPSIVDELHASKGTARLFDARESVWASRTGERPLWGVAGATVLDVPKRTSPLPLGDGGGLTAPASPRGPGPVDSRGARGGGKKDSNGTRRSFHAAGAQTHVTAPRNSLSPFDTSTRWPRGVICFLPVSRHSGTFRKDSLAS